MFKRLFFALLGLGAGVSLGVYAVRKLEAAQRALTPEHLAGAASARVGSLQERASAAVAAGRVAAAAKEAEMRAAFGVDRPKFGLDRPKFGVDPTVDRSG